MEKLKEIEQDLLKRIFTLRIADGEYEIEAQKARLEYGYTLAEFYSNQSRITMHMYDTLEEMYRTHFDKEFNFHSFVKDYRKYKGKELSLKEIKSDLFDENPFEIPVKFLKENKPDISNLVPVINVMKEDKFKKKSTPTHKLGDQFKR